MSKLKNREIFSEILVAIFSNVGISVIATLIFFIAHIFIAIWTKSVAPFSYVHAVFVFFIGVWAAFKGKSQFVTCIICYIVGAEVLWRMSGAHLYWECGKYAIAGILIIIIIKERMLSSRSQTPHLFIYFLLLLPAVFFGPNDSLDQWRQAVSFNMSGPFLILVCGVYFSSLAYDKKDLQRMFTFLIAPCISIACIAFMAIKGDPDIKWTAGSNLIASGFFGPNQVSSILGFAAFLCVILVVLNKKKLLKTVFLFLSLWFFAQSTLTLSRGGPIQAVLSAVFFMLFFAKSKIRYFYRTLFLAAIISSLVTFYIIPELHKITGGALIKRYNQTETIGRIEFLNTSKRSALVISDIETFKNNWFGIGVGKQKTIYSQTFGVALASHTEWSRLLAEHGVLGLLAMFFLWVWIIKRYRSFHDPFMQSIAISFIVFIVVNMLHSAMRTALPGFLIGFLGINFKENSEDA